MIVATIDFGLNALVQIVILAALFLYVYGVLRGTRSEQMLWGVAGIAVALYSVTRIFNFDVLLYLLGRLPTIIAIALVVVFQPELRQAFLNIGKRRMSRGDETARRGVIETVCAAAEAMSRKKVGAIIAIERGTNLREWTADATRLDAPLTRELLLAIFHPGAPLHDGGVVVKDTTIVAARCVFPLSPIELGRGTRHRAALGLSERTDAAIVVVSEETGSISVACEGHFFKDLSREALERLLTRIVPRGGLAARLAQAFGEERAPGQSKREAQS